MNEISEMVVKIPYQRLHEVVFKTYANDAQINDKHEEIQLKGLVPYSMYRQNMDKTGGHQV